MWWKMYYGDRLTVPASQWGMMLIACPKRWLFNHKSLMFYPYNMSILLEIGDPES